MDLVYGHLLKISVVDDSTQVAAMQEGALGSITKGMDGSAPKIELLSKADGNDKGAGLPKYNIYNQ